MPPTDPLTFVTDYEALCAAFLAPRASPATRLEYRRLIAEGLHAWFKRQPLTRPSQTPPPGSLPITAEGLDDEALVQLIASMTLGSLVFSEETA